MCSLPGRPLSQDNALSVLIASGVNVAIGVADDFSVRHLRFDIAWVNFSFSLLSLSGTKNYYPIRLYSNQMGLSVERRRLPLPRPTWIERLGAMRGWILWHIVEETSSSWRARLPALCLYIAGHMKGSKWNKEHLSKYT